MINILDSKFDDEIDNFVERCKNYYMNNILNSEFAEEVENFVEQYNYFPVRSLRKGNEMMEYINSQPEIHWCGEVEEW